MALHSENLPTLFFFKDFFTLNWITEVEKKNCQKILSKLSIESHSKMDSNLNEGVEK